jgi:Glycosyl transferase family 2
MNQRSDDILVSVVIPTHNRPDLLEQSVASVRQQSHRPLELVIVDDGSSSAVPAVDPHDLVVKVVRHPSPRGPAAARNTGVARCTGDHCLFLDDDDLLHPDHIRDLMRNRTDTDRDVIAGRWRRFRASEGKVWLEPPVSVPPGCTDEAMLERILDPTKEGWICGHSVLWPIVAVRELPWDETLYTNGDLDFFGRALLAGYHFKGVTAGMAYYRTHWAARVAGIPSTRGLRSSVQYRLKWGQLLRPLPNEMFFAGAMRRALMSLLLRCAQDSETVPLIPLLQPEFHHFGGRGYFIPMPPRSLWKRVAAQALLSTCGLRVTSKLLGLRNKSGEPTSQRSVERPRVSQDDEDIAIINSLLGQTH